MRKWRWRTAGASPLPCLFGAGLNLAINAGARTSADAQALVYGNAAAEIEVERNAQAIRDVAKNARLFEPAERDDEVHTLLASALDEPGDSEKQR